MDNQAYIWRMETSVFLVVVLMTFVVPMHDVIALSKTADLHGLSSAQGMLNPLPSGLCGSLEVSGFFEVIQGTSFYRVISYLTFCRAQEADCSIDDLENPYFL